MTTLISVHNSDGCVGRCDARCYDAQHPDCDCICGGANHGAGKQRAMQNTQEMCQAWIDEWKKAHQEEMRAKEIRFDVPVAQLSLL